MRSATGPQWLIRHEVSWGVEFVLWCRRGPDSGRAGITEDQWWAWMDRIAAGCGGAEAPVATAPNDHLRAVSVAEWSRFCRAWEPERRALEERIALAVGWAVQSRLRAIMGDSDDQLRLIQTSEPGALCRPVGGAWLLGQAYLEPEAFCALVERLRA